jgi:hypothetical protein
LRRALPKLKSKRLAQNKFYDRATHCYCALGLLARELNGGRKPRSFARVLEKHDLAALFWFNIMTANDMAPDSPEERYAAVLAYVRQRIAEGA